LVIIAYKYHELKICEQPYPYTVDHLILREKETKAYRQDVVKEKDVILQQFRNAGYAVIHNAQNDRSVLKRDHCHIIKFKKFKNIFQILKGWLTKS